EHHAGDAESGDSCQASQDQSDSPEEFCCDVEERENRRNPHLVGEEVHGAVETIAPEPTQCFLGAVGKENDPQDQASDGQSNVVFSSEQCLHRLSLLVRIGWLLPRERRIQGGAAEILAGGPPAVNRGSGLCEKSTLKDSQRSVSEKACRRHKCQEPAEQNAA